MRRANVRRRFSTSRRKQTGYNIADHRHRCSERRSVLLCDCNWVRNSTKTDSRNNIRLDSIRCHTQLRMAPPRIRREMLQQGLRKGSTMLMACDASISLWFSSDLSLSSILISLLCEAAFAAPRAACWFVREVGLCSAKLLCTIRFTQYSRLPPAGLVLLG